MGTCPHAHLTLSPSFWFCPCLPLPAGHAHAPTAEEAGMLPRAHQGCINVITVLNWPSHSFTSFSSSPLCLLICTAWHRTSCSILEARAAMLVLHKSGFLFFLFFQTHPDKVCWACMLILIPMLLVSDTAAHAQTGGLPNNTSLLVTEQLFWSSLGLSCLDLRASLSGNVKKGKTWLFTFLVQISPAAPQKQNDYFLLL